MLVCSIFIYAATVYAGGFQINEHNARAMGMGGAFTAVSNDPSAVYFNSAGLSFMNGTHFMLGTTMIAPQFSFRGVSPSITEYDAAKQYFFPSHFFATHQFSEKYSAGIGFTSPFGLGSKWGDNWVGKYIAIETSLQVFTISPVIAYKILDNLSISAGFVYSFATVKITKKNPQSPFAGDAFITLDGNDKAAYGYNFSLMYKPTENLTLGTSFHSQIKYDFKGTATSQGASQLASELPNGDVVATLTSPINAAFGIAWDVVPQLKLSADFQYVGWSSYDTLNVDFADPNISDLASPRLYDDSYIIRFGLEYKVFKALALQGGIYFDKNPVKKEYVNPSLPEANRVGFSFGIGYNITNNLKIDASYLFIRNAQLTVNDSQESYTDGFTPFNGTYNAYANLASLSISYGL